MHKGDKIVTLCPSLKVICMDAAGAIQRFSLGFRGPLCLVCGFTGVAPSKFALGAAVGALGTMPLQILVVGCFYASQVHNACRPTWQCMLLMHVVQLGAHAMAVQCHWNFGRLKAHSEPHMRAGLLKAPGFSCCKPGRWQPLHISMLATFGLTRRDTF